MPVCEKGLPVGTSDEPAERNHAAQDPRIAEPEDDIPLAQHLASPPMPAAHLRVGLERREIPGRAARVAAGPQ